MAQSGLTEFLLKSILDTEFRKLALSDPDSAFIGFDLSSDEKDILRSGDERVLSLLGRTLQYSAPIKRGKESIDEPSESPDPQGGAPAGESPAALPELKLRMRLVPFASGPPGGDTELSYAASLHQWTDDPASWNQADDGLTDTELHSAAVDFMIRVVPSVISIPGSESKLAYSATVEAPETGQVASAAKAPPDAAAVIPARYHGRSHAAREAAAAVTQAKPEQRQEKLLQLVSALRRGD